ncbi:Sulfatase [Hexamita inflata]|uniref:Sulfatase n=1 Tax=Hexamita inflata TaxID=28002 RepID=A0AA86TX68_9EUKA|nr:Sulfatase [Hexamita inflata]
MNFKRIYIPIAIIGCTYIFIFLKYFDKSTSNSQIVSNSTLVIPALLLYALNIAAISIFMELVAKYVSKKYIAWPLRYAVFLYYIFIIIICAFDEENSNEMQQIASQYYYKVYYFRSPSYYNDELSITGIKSKKNIALKVLKDIVARSISHWIVIFVGCFVVGVFFISFTIKYFIINTKSKNTNKNYVELKFEANQKPTNKQSGKYQLFLGLAVIAIDVITMIIFFAKDSDSIRMVAPAHWNFYKSHFKPRFSQQAYIDAVQQYRSQNQLKEGYDWIDQRETPVFPIVYAPKNVVCSYNPQLAYCPSFISDTSVQYESPNVVVIIIESFTPGPMMLGDKVVESQDPIVSGPLYKEIYLPTLKQLSETGTSFSSLSSNGLPTVFGWYSLTTGEIPNSNSINMMQSIFNDVDDYPSFFKQQGYNSLYISPSNLKFDGKHNWVFRGKEVVRNKQDLKEFPLWFDDVVHYFPNEEQAAELGVEQTLYQSWVPDRITSTQFIKYFEEAKTKSGKPILGVWATVDTHMPFMGYDDHKFYEPFKFGSGVESMKGQHKVDRYTTLAKYADHYIGEVVDYIKQNHNNTVLVVLGDHGAREVPLLKNEQVDPRDPNSAFYDDSCNGQPFSNDQLFTTTSVINYFGDNQQLKDKFDALKKKVIKVPTDHQDMIRTLYDIVEDTTGKHLASSRNGRNLLELANNLTANLPLRTHWSLRSTTLYSELATESTLYRYHSLGAYGEQFAGIYPTCVTGEIRSKITSTQHKQFRIYQKLFDYLQRNNKQFSYKFRDENCIIPKTCTFPVNGEAYNKNIPLQYSMTVIFVGAGVGLLIYFVDVLFHWLKQKKRVAPVDRNRILRQQLIME